MVINCIQIYFVECWKEFQGLIKKKSRSRINFSLNVCKCTYKFISYRCTTSPINANTNTNNNKNLANTVNFPLKLSQRLRLLTSMWSSNQDNIWRNNVTEVTLATNLLFFLLRRTKFIEISWIFLEQPRSLFYSGAT